MKGQWIGKATDIPTGRNSGGIIINIDDLGTHYAGAGYLLPDQQQIPGSFAQFQTRDKNTESNFKIKLLPINPYTQLPDVWQNVKPYYPSEGYAEEADVTLRFKENELYLKIITTLGTEVQSTITKKPFSTESEIQGDTKPWDDYKSMVSDLCGQNNLFRGQQKPWKLRTSFHRKGRYDLDRFLDEDRLLLHRVLSARTSHFFNLDIPQQNGAFINLMQHHGYPTPLLDWTRSPYVAAFFAFRQVPRKIGDHGEFARIFILDYDRWCRDFKQLSVLNPAGLHLSVMEFIAIGNERLLVPQQAITTTTNTDDIESYIKSMELENQCSYLRAINISVAEREKVMKELAFMGITAGSMFPGLDGACEELREKMFDA
jgi:hypothetical protein